MNEIITELIEDKYKEEKAMDKDLVRSFVEEIWENLVWEGMEAILYKDGETFVRQEGSAGTDEDDIIYKVSLSSNYWGESYALDWDEESEEYIKDKTMKEDFIDDVTNEVLNELKRRN